MLNRTKKVLLFAFFVVFLLPLSGLAEDAPDPNLPGNPDCAQCHGIGKIEYGKKAGDTKLIDYCYYKDAKKRCPVLLGGWEACEACEDWPQMQALFNEHDNLVKTYRAEGARYTAALDQAQPPIRKFNYLCGNHSSLLTNAPHDRIHGLVVWTEKCLEQFSSDFSLGETGSDWELAHTGDRKFCFIMLNSKDEFVKNVEWFYNSPYISTNTKMMGLETLKSLGGIGFLVGQMTYLTDSAENDERGIIKTYSGNLLYEAFLSVEGAQDPFPAWITEGLSDYYQSKLRQIVTWAAVAYGQGTQRDAEKWGPFQNWLKELAEANKVAKSALDERTGSWKGLIPMDTVLNFRITNISAQGVVQSWAMINYFMGEGESSKKKREEAKAEFKQYLKLVGSGVDQREALKQVYKVKSVESLEAKFRIWLKKFAK